MQGARSPRLAGGIEGPGKNKFTGKQKQRSGDSDHNNKLQQADGSYQSFKTLANPREGKHIEYEVRQRHMHQHMRESTIRLQEMHGELVALAGWTLEWLQHHCL
jgi:hypothetical protein